MNVSQRISPWWWLLLGAGALMLYLRYTRNGQTFFADAIDEVTISAKKIGTALTGGWLAKVPQALKGIFAAASIQYGLPPNLLEAVAYRESRFRPDVISGALRSMKGAVGIMQFVLRWHPELTEADALNPARAIPAAAAYLRQLYNRFGDWKLALAAYNWGQGNLQKDLADRIVGNEWPAETRAYVDEIASNAGLHS